MVMERERQSEEQVAQAVQAPYEPPAVAWEEPFDPVAASCDPLIGYPTDPDCPPP